ncbi:MAG TPA: hypothetical protein VMF89_26585, partial [Polyangiales bacterium]|nr:hypothetical protein [Polyangiales bacterium]
MTQRWRPEVLQSLPSTHSTQLPLPLHTPPVQAWWADLGVLPHVALLLAHVADRHVLLGTGQSVAATHCTHCPLPVQRGALPVHVVRVIVWPRVSQASTVLPL